MTLVRPFVEDLLTLVETDGVSEVVAKHRCAAELLAGIIRGAKHWYHVCLHVAKLSMFVFISLLAYKCADVSIVYILK